MYLYHYKLENCARKPFKSAVASRNTNSLGSSSQGWTDLSRNLSKIKAVRFRIVVFPKKDAFTNAFGSMTLNVLTTEFIRQKLLILVKLRKGKSNGLKERCFRMRQCIKLYSRQRF